MKYLVVNKTKKNLPDSPPSPNLYMYLEFQRLGNMGKYEDHETDGWNLTAKIKTSCSRRVYHGSSISVLFVMVLTFCCFALNVKWAFAASSSSPSHVSAGVISSEYNNRLDESLQQLHQHNDVRPQEDESFLLNEVDDDVQCKLFNSIQFNNGLSSVLCLLHALLLA